MENNLPIWGLEDIWNESVGTKPERKMVPRDYVHASELGGAMIDTYLKMKGVEFSNCPNQRSKRKFDAGEIWEDITAEVLKRAGILIETQESLNNQLPGMCAVHGRLDHYAGGKPDMVKVQAYFEGKDEGSLNFLDRTARNLAEIINRKYPAGLRKQIMEIKSSSLFLFPERQRKPRADTNHELQCFHYLLVKGEHTGRIEYVNKDDCMIKGFTIFNEPGNDIDTLYRAKLAEITNYYKTDTQPPLEKEIFFDEDLFKFKKNWKIEYSNYLTMLYGYSEPESYRERWASTISRFNRVFARVVSNAKMTNANFDCIKEAKAFFPDFDLYVDKAKLAIKGGETLLVEEEENGNS